MSAITWPHQPNKITQQVANGNTNWTKVTVPSGVPSPSGLANVSVAMRSVNAAGTAAGSLFYVDFDKSTNPTVGWPVVGGEADVFTFNNDLYIKNTVAGDLIYLVWSF